MGQREMKESVGFAIIMTSVVGMSDCCFAELSSKGALEKGLTM